MINKYQAGGAAPQGGILQEIAKLPQDQQKKIMTAFGKWAQAKGLNLQQLQGNESALEQAMGQFLQEMQASQAPKARLGAKLNYIRELKGNAPEGMEVVYYKCGGQVKKKFVKAAGGAKAKDGKKEIADFKKACGGKAKKACGGRKFEDGGKSQKPKYTKDQIAGRTPVKVVNGVKYFLNGDGQVVKDPKGKNSGSWTLEDDNKMLKYRLKGTKNPSEKRDSILNQMKWNNLPESEKKKHEVQELKCGGKAKKHQLGGSLNRIPFYLAGTPKGGIEKSDNTRVSRVSNNGEGVYEKTPLGIGDFLPLVGTYRAALRIDKGEPGASYSDLAINGVMDALGAGMVGSVAKAAGRVGKLHKALKASGYSALTKDGSQWYKLPKYIMSGLGNKLYTWRIPNLYGAPFKIVPTVNYAPAAMAPMVLTLRVPATAPFKK